MCSRRGRRRAAFVGPLDRLDPAASSHREGLIARSVATVQEALARRLVDRLASRGDAELPVDAAHVGFTVFGERWTLAAIWGNESGRGGTGGMRSSATLSCAAAAADWRSMSSCVVSAQRCRSVASRSWSRPREPRSSRRCAWRVSPRRAAAPASTIRVSHSYQGVLP